MICFSTCFELCDPTEEDSTQAASFSSHMVAFAMTTLYGCKRTYACARLRRLTCGNWVAMVVNVDSSDCTFRCIGKIIAQDQMLVGSWLYHVGVTRPWTHHLQPCHYTCHLCTFFNGTTSLAVSTYAWPRWWQSMDVTAVVFKASAQSVLSISIANFLSASAQWGDLPGSATRACCLQDEGDWHVTRWSALNANWLTALGSLGVAQRSELEVAGRNSYRVIYCNRRINTSHELRG